MYIYTLTNLTYNICIATPLIAVSDSLCNNIELKAVECIDVVNNKVIPGYQALT